VSPRPQAGHGFHGAMLVSLVCCIGIALSGCSTEPRVAPAPPFDTWATLPPTGSVGEPEAVGPWRVTVTEIDTADISTNRQVTPDKDATVSVHFAVRPKDPQQAAHWQDGLSWRFAGANNISYRGTLTPNEDSKTRQTATVQFVVPQGAVEGTSAAVVTDASTGQGVAYLTP